MRVITVYDDEREMIVTYVSAYGLQRQSTKANAGQTKKSSRRDFILNIRIHIIKQYKRGLSSSSIFNLLLTRQ